MDGSSEVPYSTFPHIQHLWRVERSSKATDSPQWQWPKLSILSKLEMTFSMYRAHRHRLTSCLRCVFASFRKYIWSKKKIKNKKIMIDFESDVTIFIFWCKKHKNYRKEGERSIKQCEITTTKKKSLVAFVIWFCYAVGAVLVLNFFLVFSRNFRHSDRGGVQNTPKKALFKCQFKYIYLNSNFTFKTKQKRNIAGLNSLIFFFFFLSKVGTTAPRVGKKSLWVPLKRLAFYSCVPCTVGGTPRSLNGSWKKLSLCGSLSPDTVCVPGKRTGAETKHQNQNGFYSAFSQQHGTKVHCAMR